VLLDAPKKERALPPFKLRAGTPESSSSPAQPREANGERLGVGKKLR